MYSSSEAIVLQLNPYKDNSAVVKLYTRESGLISCWVRSIHSKTSKTKAAILQPLHLIKAEISYRENNNMPALKEVSLAVSTQNIALSLEKSSIAIFISELLLHILKESSQDISLYDFIRNAIILLNSTPEKCSNFHIHFMIRLCDHLGFLPTENYSAQTPYFDLEEGKYVEKEPMHPYFLFPAESKCFHSLSSLDMEDFYKAEIGSGSRKKLLHGLLEYYRIHLGISPLKSHLVLEEVL